MFSERFNSHPRDAGRGVSIGNQKGYVEWVMPLNKSTADDNFEKIDELTKEDKAENNSGEDVTRDSINYSQKRTGRYYL